MYSDGRGTDKITQDKTFQTKYKTPGQKPREQLREFVQGDFVRFFVLGLLKIGGGVVRDVLRTFGVSGCVTKCDRGRGPILVQNSVTCFMDGS